MLTRGRLTVVSALAPTAILAAWVAASPASATPAAASAPAAPAARPGHKAAVVPTSAAARLAGELRSAWQITRGEGATVAVLSTPVDPVAGLAGKLIQGPDYAPLAGAPAIEGTVLASLIAGSGPTAANPTGTVGRAPGARILAETIADYRAGPGSRRYQADGTWQSIEARAIRYAVNHGADVIVPDERGDSDTKALASAVAYAESKNVVVVGNGFASARWPADPEYPDDLPGVINFSGTALRRLPKPPQAGRFPVNSSVLVEAPDNPVYATGPGNLPYTVFGEFTARAWVAGTVALIKSVYPEITPAQVARALAISASYHPPGGYDTTAGFGLINPAGALHAAQSLRRLHATAAAGPSVVSPGSRLGGSAPTVIDAVHHAPGTLAGFSSAILAGLILLTVTPWLVWRRRRAVPPASGRGAGQREAEDITVTSLGGT